MSVKPNKKISCTISLSSSLWKKIQEYKQEIKTKYGVRINLNPFVESFLGENILPYLDYLKENSFVSYETYKKQFLMKTIDKGLTN